MEPIRPPQIASHPFILVINQSSSFITDTYINNLILYIPDYDRINIDLDASRVSFPFGQTFQQMARGGESIEEHHPLNSGALPRHTC
jgi:hypothetical protein